MFSQACVKNSVWRNGRACMVNRGMCGEWLAGACMVNGGMHVKGDMHGKGGMHGKGACMVGTCVAKGVCMCGGGLLECILVYIRCITCITGHMVGHAPWTSNSGKQGANGYPKTFFVWSVKERNMLE